jgi:hypothetical protein
MIVVALLAMVFMTLLMVRLTPFLCSSAVAYKV